MRKKTHVLLAGFLAKELNYNELMIHKKAFCLGSVLPDLNPKMVAVPHTYDVTWSAIRRCFGELLSGTGKGECKGRVLWRRLGIVFHYLADYFTFPHNTCFTGTLREHCHYEAEMKYRMRLLVWSREAGQIFQEQQEKAQEIQSPEMLFAYIEKQHRSYMQQEREHTPADDCRWIIELCSTVILAAVRIICEEGAGELGMQYRCA